MSDGSLLGVCRFMVHFSDLNAKELVKVVHETRAAIRCGQNLLRYVNTNGVTLGVQLMAAVTPDQIDALEKELGRLEEELSKKIDT